MDLGKVSEPWRFPVKSMAGELVAAAEVGARGVHGDRLWAVRDEDKGVITHAKRLPALLMCSARFAAPAAPTPWVTDDRRTPGERRHRRAMG